MGGFDTNITERDGAPPPITNEQLIDLVASAAGNEVLIDGLTFIVATASFGVAMFAALVAYMPVRAERRRVKRKVLFLRIQWLTNLIRLRSAINIFELGDLSKESKIITDALRSDIHALSNQCEILEENEQLHISEIFIYLEAAYMDYLHSKHGDKNGNIQKLKERRDKYMDLLTKLEVYPSVK
jgi:hypothetical protein